ncbi:MAG: ISKra4 family transposase, partial [Dehalococcoidia bacterium]|nr:ISKra4 family transposase [Dehalococcoidia bacterium]
AETLRQQREYFQKNALRMDYPAFRARGLPIGSGAVESSAKNLVQQRMKRPGSRWSENGAQAVLNVRARLLSQLPLAS